MVRLTFILAALFPLCSMAQTQLDSTENAKILIIPFEEKLFYCDIMRDLTSANQMTANDIYHRLRNEIQLSLSAALKDSMETAMFLNTDSITEEDLVDIYSVLGYRYIPIPIKEELQANGKKSKKAEPEPQREKEVGLRNGQVVAQRDVAQRYMSAQLKDHAVLNRFYTTYGLNRFLFINQMDVKMDMETPETAFLDPKRVVAIHYTIMDKDGKEISGGLATVQFPGTESNLNHIIGSTFYKVSASVLKGLVEAKKKEEDETEKNRKSKTE